MNWPEPQEWELAVRLFRVMLGAALFAFILSEVTRNYSQVDRLWSLMPILYAALVWVWTDFSPRGGLMAGMVTVWGIRLTFNFARKGGYRWPFWKAEEDYRWAILRNMPPLNRPWIWRLFNLGFISFYQMALILAFTLPIIPGSLASRALGPMDFLWAALMLTAIVVETISDEQQWRFQQAKKKYQESGLRPVPDAIAKGFVMEGLWSRVRHPNYAMEQLVWIVFYLWGAWASGTWLHWTMTGCVLLVLLFYNSALFAEKISGSKYPDYAEYKKKAGMFWPRF
ncbi:MAG: DUF1295 domain-containing protein [Flavobacteriales bacterium]|nr:DUF1295 domain-containing protein [Flavobacteriales bacterium]